MTDVPLHHRIRRELEEQIQAGALPPGARLPTEDDLRKKYGVSRNTAQRVLNDLANAGLAVRRRRLGTFVSDRTPQIDLLNFAAPEIAEKATVTPGRHEVVSARVTTCGAAVLRLPGAEDDTAVVELVRRKLDLRDRAHSIERHVILFSIASDLLDQDLEEFVSLRFLRDRNVPLESIRIYIEPIALDRHDAHLLDSGTGDLSLLRRRETRTSDGAVVEVVTTVVRPGTAQFFVEHQVPAT